MIKLRKNKKFDYSPRYYKKDGEGSPFEIKHKFDEYRKTVGPNSGIKTKVNNALDDLKAPKDVEVNKRIFIIVTILILVFLFIIDFDFSFFDNV